MIAKEKAEELFKRFHPMTYTAVHAQNTTGEYADAIKCALIAVDEIMKQCFDYRDIDLQASYDYWLEVKSEIEKL